MDKLIYTKYSTDRDERYAIRTDRLIDDKGNEIIKKIALFDEGIEHLQNMVAMSHKLQKRYGDKIRISKSSVEGKVLSNEFVEGESLLELFIKRIENSDKDEVVKLLEKYKSIVDYDSESTTEFCMSAEFVEVFGEQEELAAQGLLSANVTDIDMILENIIVSDDGIWQLIDYEWTFGFLIPQKYVLYRTLMYLFVNSDIKETISWVEMMDWAGINEKTEECFENMERHFQDHITSNRMSIEDEVEISDKVSVPLSSMVNSYNKITYYEEKCSRLKKELQIKEKDYKKYKTLVDEQMGHYNELKDLYMTQAGENARIRRGKFYKIDNKVNRLFGESK